MNRIPHIAAGQVVPDGVKSLEQQIKEAKQKQEKREQRRHNYLVAAFSSVCGGITGFLALVMYKIMSVVIKRLKAMPNNVA